MKPARGAAGMPQDRKRLGLLAAGLVAAEPGRCIQCGICAFNCPMGLNPRVYARDGLAITDPACILCGSCVAHCPRGTLRFELPAKAAAHETPAEELSERAA